MKLRRSSRQRADREVFAPNKYEKNMSYELNEKRAMAKKIEATSRESDVKIEPVKLSPAVASILNFISEQKTLRL